MTEIYRTRPYSWLYQLGAVGERQASRQQKKKGFNGPAERTKRPTNGTTNQKTNQRTTPPTHPHYVYGLNIKKERLRVFVEDTYMLKQ